MKSADLAPRVVKNGPDVLNRVKYLAYVIFVPLVDQDGEAHFLFQKRASGIRQGGEISFPGGGFEPAIDHDTNAAAVRESAEELGLPAGQIKVNGPLGMILTHWGALIDVFVGTIAPEGEEFLLTSCNPNPAEVERLFTVPVSWFLDHPPEIHHVKVEVSGTDLDDDGKELVLLPAVQLGLPERYHGPWGKRIFPVPFYHAKGEVIWGITAEIVGAIVDRLGG